MPLPPPAPLYEQIIEQTRSMRAAQRLYFSTRDRAALQQAQAFERQVDSLLRRWDARMEHPDPLQERQDGPLLAGHTRDHAARMVRVYGPPHAASMMGVPVEALQAFVGDARA
jgi:hypothetical protein